MNGNALSRAGEAGNDENVQTIDHKRSELLIFLGDDFEDFLSCLSFDKAAAESGVLEQSRDSRQSLQMIGGGILRAIRTKNRCVGPPSKEAKSTPSKLRAKMPTTRSTPRSFPCGIATPSPMAVVLIRSRSNKTSRTLFSSSAGWLATNPVAISFRTAFFSRATRAGITASLVRKSVIFTLSPFFD